MSQGRWANTFGNIVYVWAEEASIVHWIVYCRLWRSALNSQHYIWQRKVTLAGVDRWLLAGSFTDCSARLQWYKTILYKNNVQLWPSSFQACCHGNMTLHRDYLSHDLWCGFVKFDTFLVNTFFLKLGSENLFLCDSLWARQNTSGFYQTSIKNLRIFVNLIQVKKENEMKYNYWSLKKHLLKQYMS